MSKEGKYWFILISLIFFSINSIGQPINESAYEEIIRVACVGNSVTYGYGLKNRSEESYPVVLQNKLGGNYLVKNFGFSGATLLKKGHNPYWQTKEYKNSLDFKPHIIIIHLGLNDTDPRNWPNYQDDFIEDYTDLINSYLTIDSQPKPEVWICKMTPIFSGHSRFKAGTRDWFWQIQESIGLIAQHNDVGLIDLHTPLYDRPDLFPDYLHPTKEGAGIIADKVYSLVTGDFSGLELPNIFSDHMVLQREVDIPVWGNANYNEKVKVAFNQSVLETVAGVDGKWQVKFQAMEAGGPYKLTISTDYDTVSVEDILIGEVWLCSGQSNMAFKLDESERAKEEIPNANYPDIRFLNLKAAAWAGKQEWSHDVLEKINKLDFFHGTWEKCAPATAKDFSAIGYHFGKKLHEDLDIPIGLILNAKGGSPAESWIDRKTLEFHPQLVDILDDWKSSEMVQPWCRERGAYNIQKTKNEIQRHPFEATYLFDAGIKPLTQFPIKGVIWYQGESNAHNIELHESIFPTLVECWRLAWGYDFPFYYVQLSSLNRPSWSHFRDSQRRMEAIIPNSAMVVSSDLGHPTDVHPKQKMQIGQRLALCAEAETYGLDKEFSGPKVKMVELIDGKIIISFSHARQLNSKNLKLTGFQIAGEDKMYHDAHAEIDGGKVILSSESIESPYFIRYAWKPYTKANLYNGSDLPASTFEYEIK